MISPYNESSENHKHHDLSSQNNNIFSVEKFEYFPKIGTLDLMVIVWNTGCPGFDADYIKE